MRMLASQLTPPRMFQKFVSDKFTQVINGISDYINTLTLLKALLCSHQLPCGIIMPGKLRSSCDVMLAPFELPRTSVLSRKGALHRALVHLTLLARKALLMLSMQTHRQSMLGISTTFLS